MHRMPAPLPLHCLRPWIVLVLVVVLGLLALLVALLAFLAVLAVAHPTTSETVCRPCGLHTHSRMKANEVHFLTSPGPRCGPAASAGVCRVEQFGLQLHKDSQELDPFPRHFRTVCVCDGPVCAGSTILDASDMYYLCIHTIINLLNCKSAPMPDQLSPCTFNRFPFMSKTLCYYGTGTARYRSWRQIVSS